MTIEQYNVKFYIERNKFRNCLVIFCNDKWQWEYDYMGKLKYYGVTGAPFKDSSHLGHGICSSEHIRNNCRCVNPEDVLEAHPFLLRALSQLYGKLTEVHKGRWAYIQEVEDESDGVAS